MSVKIKMKDVKRLTKVTEKLITAVTEDLQTLKNIDAKGPGVKEATGFLKSLVKAVKTFAVVEKAEDIDDARNLLGGVNDLCDEYSIDDVIWPVFTAMMTLGMKSKVVKLIKEESLYEFVYGLSEELSEIEMEEIEEEEE